MLPILPMLLTPAATACDCNPAEIVSPVDDGLIPVNGELIVQQYAGPWFDGRTVPITVTKPGGDAVVTEREVWRTGGDDTFVRITFPRAEVGDTLEIDLGDGWPRYFTLEVTAADTAPPPRASRIVEHRVSCEGDSCGPFEFRLELEDAGQVGYEVEVDDGTGELWTLFSRSRWTGPGFDDCSASMVSKERGHHNRPTELSLRVRTRDVVGRTSAWSAVYTASTACPSEDTDPQAPDDTDCIPEAGGSDCDEPEPRSCGCTSTSVTSSAVVLLGGLLGLAWRRRERTGA